MKKLIIGFVAVIAVFNHMGAMESYDYNRLVKEGSQKEIIVKQETTTEASGWHFSTSACSGFTLDGSMFQLVGNNRGLKNTQYTLNGNQVCPFVSAQKSVSNVIMVEDESNYEPEIVGEGFLSRRFVPVFSRYDQYRALTRQLCTQPLGAFDHITLAEIEYPRQKTQEDMFIYYNPEYGIDATQPVCLHGFLYAIVTRFPDESLEDASKENVVQYVQENKHVCGYEIKDRKLVLVRDFGKYPYCTGLYVNTKKPMIAVLYGNGVETEKCLKFITLYDRTLSSTLNKGALLSDVDIVCNN